MQNYLRAGALALAAFGVNPSYAGPAPLSLSETVTIAIAAQDPSLLSFDSRAAAFEEHAIADAQLPDPTIRSSLVNLPTDSFDFEQENMTQLQVGLRQQFPAGQTLSLRGERRRIQAEIERVRKDLTLREIELAVRTSWYDRFYLMKAQSSVRESQQAVSELIEALHASYASGKLTSQQVLRAELERSLLDDRLTNLAQRDASARADLVRFIGSAALRTLPDTLPSLPLPPDFADMEAALVQHPAVLIEDANIEVRSADIALAEQSYQPSWALEAGYGSRGGGRSDFANIGVTLSIPLFTDRRQDRRVSAAANERAAARLDRATRLMDLRRSLERTYSDWRFLGDRIALYDNVVINRANETTEATFSTYANDRADFPELIRSQLAQLETELKQIELHTQRGKAWARLNYLAGHIQ